MNNIERNLMDGLNLKSRKLVEKLNTETEITDNSFTIVDLLQKIEDLKTTIICNCSNQLDLDCREIKSLPKTFVEGINIQPVYGCPIDN